MRKCDAHNIVAVIAQQSLGVVARQQTMVALFALDVWWCHAAAAALSCR